MTVIPFPKPYTGPLSKRQIAAKLDRSPRWIELRMREGLPHWRNERGEARFDLTAVQEWRQAKEVANG